MLILGVSTGNRNSGPVEIVSCPCRALLFCNISENCSDMVRDSIIGKEGQILGCLSSRYFKFRTSCLNTRTPHTYLFYYFPYSQGGETVKTLLISETTSAMICGNISKHDKS